jgi:hypothetical protein
MQKGPSHCWPGQVSRAGLTSRYSTLPLCITGGPKHFLLTNYSWSVIFWTRPAATFGDLFICAKDLFVEATASPADIGAEGTSAKEDE